MCSRSGLDEGDVTTLCHPPRLGILYPESFAIHAVSTESSFPGLVLELRRLYFDVHEGPGPDRADLVWRARRRVPWKGLSVWSAEWGMRLTRSYAKNSSVYRRRIRGQGSGGDCQLGNQARHRGLSRQVVRIVCMEGGRK